MTHPRDLELDSFLNRTASARELVDVGMHLAECAECRARLEAKSGGPNVRDGIAGLHRELAQARWEEHLSEEDVQVLAQGGRAPGAESHMRRCASCRAEVADLRQFIQSRERQSRPQPVRAPYWLAAAALMVAGISFLLWRSAHPQQQAHPMPAEYAALVERTRTGGRLEIAPAIAALSRVPERLMGDSPPPAPFTLLRPVGEASVASRPEFSWQPMSGATGYRVDVYDEEFRRIESSPEIAATSWTSDQALDSAHIYSWTVTARLNAGKELREPIPPAPEAKFAIVPPDQAAQLSEAARQYPNDHLLLAALYAKAGAIDQARRELRATGDPDLARRLAASLDRR